MLCQIHPVFFNKSTSQSKEKLAVWAKFFFLKAFSDDYSRIAIILTNGTLISLVDANSKNTHDAVNKTNSDKLAHNIFKNYFYFGKISQEYIVFGKN